MKKLFTLSISLLLITVINVQAALIHTKEDGNWSNTLTWDGGILPGITDDVQIDNNDDITVITGNSFTIAELWMGNGSSLTIEGDLTIDSLHVNNNATLNVTGTFTVLGGISISQNAGLTINTSGTMDVQGDVTASNGASLTVDGNLSIDGDVSFDGNGSIDVGDTGTIEIGGDFDSGNATIEGTGPINVDGAVSGTNSGDSQINGTLPIELISFDLKLQNKQVLVSWSTATEINNDYFTIQRSDDGIEFYDIGTLQGTGNSNSLLLYDFIDSNPSSLINYYRLMQTDYDGKYEIFKPKSINTEIEHNVLKSNLYPNPAHSYDIINILADGFNPEKGSFVEITIMDKNGSITLQTTAEINEYGQVHKSLSSTIFSKGIYIVWLQGNNKVLSKKLIIN